MSVKNIIPEDSLSDVIASSEPGDRIVLAPGIYRDKIEIHIPDIELIGSSADDTVIVWDDYAKKPDENGVEYNTFRTYTAAVLAPGVTFRGLTVKNDALSPETKGQEVALTVCADRFCAERCRFISTQDTVFCGPLPDDLIERYDGFLKDELRRSGKMRQIFRECLISGNVDFISDAVMHYLRIARYARCMMYADTDILVRRLMQKAMISVSCSASVISPARMRSPTARYSSQDRGAIMGNAAL